MVKKHFAKIAMIGLVLCSARCTTAESPRGMPCSEFVDSQILSLAPSSLRGEMASMQWVITSFRTTNNGLKWARHTDGRHSLTWLVDDNREYSLSLDANEIGVSLGLGWLRQKPSITDLLRCLGNPDGYRALYRTQPEGTYTMVDFVYVAKGIEVGTYVKGRVLATLATELFGLGIGAPEIGLEGWNHRLLQLNSGERIGKRDRSVLTFKAWPGTLGQLEYIDTTISAE